MILSCDISPSGFPCEAEARVRHGRFHQRDPAGYVDGMNLYEAFKSDEFFQLWITSTLPPMHATALIEHNGSPDACVYCKRYGYMLGKPQPLYTNIVLEAVEDWNFSHEWLAPHAVSCPSLICKQRVVQEIMKLEYDIDWMPCLMA